LGGVGISYALAVAGATLAVLVIYLVYRHAARLLDRLGEVGMLVLMRIMAFVLLRIGIEIIWTGWAELQLQAR
jgi:multiple antibiotic resistance protein